MPTAESAMNMSVVTVSPSDTVEQAAYALMHGGVSAAAVLDQESHLVGIITEYQLLQLVYDENVKSEPVSNYMTREVLTVDAHDPLEKAANLFVLHRIRVLPVIENDRLVGTITRSGIIREILLDHLPAHPVG